MPSLNSKYQTFLNAVASLMTEGLLSDRVQRAHELLKPLASETDDGPVFDDPALQSRFDSLFTNSFADDPAIRAQEILQLFEEVSAVYHVWISHAGRSC